MGSRDKAKKPKNGSGLRNSSSMDQTEDREAVETEAQEYSKHCIIFKTRSFTDPEFYEYLRAQSKELLEFNEEDTDDDAETDIEVEENDVGEHPDVETENKEEASKNVITSKMVDSWCNEIHSGAKKGAIRSLLRAFRSACHYGDDSDADPTAKLTTMSSDVFNKIMVVVLSEMDGILRGLLKLPPLGGKRETIVNLMATRKWKNYGNLVKSYLGNALHVLNQMTDNEMIVFMLRRLKYSSVMLAAFPVLLRKYIKVTLHFWGTGNASLSLVSFAFLHELCGSLGSLCLDDCIKGTYKAYISNCHFVNATQLQHIQFLGKCFVELLRVDASSSYQHAFVYIRQLAMILKEALSGSTKKKTKKKGEEAPPNSTNKKGKEASSSSRSKKETFRKVYQWKYINCLELWTRVVCEYSSEAALRPLAYPLTQIITGAARLLPSACYFPLRLRCVRMLNQISASTGTFVPVSLLLLDMLEMKELRKPPTGGVGKAVDLFSILKVSKSALKTRAFQEACVFSVVEELTEHLAQWSYSIAFLELSFVPSVRLRNFCKSTKVERFCREMRHLIRQIEANSEFINKKRTAVSFLPNNPAAAAFLEDDKKSVTSPLSKYVSSLRQRAQERNDVLKKSSMLIGDRTSKFGDDNDDDDYNDDDDSEIEESAAALKSGNESRDKPQKNGKKKKIRPSEEEAFDEDIIEDLILSSDEDDPASDSPDEEDSELEGAPRKLHNQKQNPPFESSEKKTKLHKKSKKRKRSQKK